MCEIVQFIYPYNIHTHKANQTNHCQKSYTKDTICKQEINPSQSNIINPLPQINKDNQSLQQYSPK